MIDDQTLRDIMDSVAEGDGSRERAEQLGAIVKDAEQMRVLLENPAFQTLLSSFQGQMKTRLRELITKDPELTALMNIMNRTLGFLRAAEKAEEALQDIVNSDV